MNRVYYNMRQTMQAQSQEDGIYPPARLTLAARNRRGPAAEQAATAYPGALPMRPATPAENPGGAKPQPIWLAALLATNCQARSHGRLHDIRWNCVEGRALYTNFGRDAEKIEPLGVSLSVGETLAVSWNAGETAYTLEVYSQTELCA
jgi:hypothetical protein